MARLSTKRVADRVAMEGKHYAVVQRTIARGIIHYANYKANGHNYGVA